MSADEKMSPLAEAMIKYLDCPCEYLAPANHDENIMRAYTEAKERGGKEGFIPVMVTADDENLLLMLIANIGSNDAFIAGKYNFDIEDVRAYRWKMLSQPVVDANEIFSDNIDRVKRWLNEGIFDSMCTDGEQDILDAEPGNALSSYWDYPGQTLPLILAEIPVKNPWEIFAYVPFGGWNECPGTQELMSAGMAWYKKYKAVPAMITSSQLEFVLPEPVDREGAAKAALDHLAFCIDIMPMSSGDALKYLTDYISISTVWSFWWD